MRTLAISLLLAAAPAAFSQNAGKTGRTFGMAVAPVIIEVYSDFQCPACKALHEQTLKPVMENYVRKGRVYMVHRAFPLPMHAHARQAAGFACAADRVGKYEQVCDALFAQQASWSASGNVESAVAAVLTPTEMKQVRALIKDPAIQAEIQKDIDLG